MHAGKLALVPPPALRTLVAPTERRASSTGWWLGAYVAALAYASLYPWAGWRAPHASMFDFATAPWPRWWTAFDVATNVLAYLPLGVLLAIAIARALRIRASRAAPVAVVLAAALSFGFESAQGLLPSRVPSQLDVATNAAGAAVGAALAAWFGRRRVERWPHSLRGAFAVAPGATGGALLLVAWPIAQWYPQSLVFATGDLLLAWPSPSGAAPSGWWSSLILPARFEPFAEAGAVSLAVIAIGSMVRDVLVARPGAGTWATAWPIALPIVAACAIKSLAGAAVLGSAHAFGWLNAATQGGLLAGSIALIVLAPAGPRLRRGCALASIAVATVLFNLAPPNEYYLSMRAHWAGEWTNFHGLLRALATVWPFAALAWCGWRLRARL